MFPVRAFPLAARLAAATRVVSVSTTSTRAFTRTTLFKAGTDKKDLAHHDDHHHAPEPILVGPGAKPGAVPTDFDQATGIERLEFLAKMQGYDFFDMEPLKVDHYGTKKNPIYVRSGDEERIVGCSGFPKESHEVLWFNLTPTKEGEPPKRCLECGQVFKLIPNVPSGQHHDPKYNPKYIPE